MKNIILTMIFFILKSEMDQLTSDELSHIMSFIKRNNDKYNLLRVCKQMGNCRFYFYENIIQTEISESQFYNHFIDVTVNDTKKLPNSIKKLTFSVRFNNLIDNYIPLGVTHLTFNGYFKQLDSKGNPSSITQLIIKDHIPSSVTHLQFGYNFNGRIDNCIPSGITHLTFGWNFNQPIKDCIPSSVTHLIFGFCFNQPIDDCIPPSVTHLKFGTWFNPKDKCIPFGVTHLTFGNYFNRPIDGCIPSSVTHLILDEGFNQPINDCIPCSVKYLEFKGNYQHPIENYTIPDIIINGIKKIEK